MARKLPFKKNKKKFAAAVLIFSLLVISLIFFALFRDKPDKQTAIVLDPPLYALCTMDVPSSSCGPTEVRVKFKDGSEKILYIPGFDNRNPDPKDEKNKDALREAGDSGEEVEITFEGDIIKNVE